MNLVTLQCRLCRCTSLLSTVQTRVETGQSPMAGAAVHPCSCHRSPPTTINVLLFIVKTDEVG